MQRTERRWLPALLIACVLGLLVASTAASAPPSRTKSFRLTGSVSGLYPGGVRPMVVTIANLSRQALDVRTIRVASVSSRRKGCSARLISSPGWSGHQRLPRSGTRRVSIPIQMAAAAPQACVGASFKLTLTGTATRR